MRAVALTTSDNPYNPFDDYAKWHSWDTLHGYNTPGDLARVARTSGDLSEADQLVAIEDAIDEIIAFNLTGNYEKLEIDE